MIEVLGHTRFEQDGGGWHWPSASQPYLRGADGGLVVSAPAGKTVVLLGSGVHTWNGDSIELTFSPMGRASGKLRFGFDAVGHEHALLELDFDRGHAELLTTDWTRPQPVASAPFYPPGGESHTLVIDKTESGGGPVKNADLAATLDGSPLLATANLNVIPEMGVKIEIEGMEVLLREFVHKGRPSGVPEFLHVAGWQMLNVESIEHNLDSMRRGVLAAAELGVELLVTPETSLTGLFASSHVTRESGPVAEAERELRTFLSGVKDAPFLAVGLPEWKAVDGHALGVSRYNVCRVYDPDGDVVSTHSKVHSAEENFAHGYRLNEFEVKGVPVALHICHDGRYPELWTLPVMFGARLIVQPSNSGKVSGTVEAFGGEAREKAGTTQVFHLRVNGGGGSYIVGPRQDRGLYHELKTVSPESAQDNPNAPLVGEPVEALFHHRIRIHDAFGYWPVRSYRASEEIAAAYTNLYETYGGTRSGRLTPAGVAAGAD